MRWSIDDPLGQRLLGAHVAERAEQVAGQRQAGVALDAGQAEVGDPEVAPASSSRLAGLMSRWRTPWRWACSSASAAWMPRRAAVRKKARRCVEGPLDDGVDVGAWPGRGRTGGFRRRGRRWPA